MKNKTYQKTTYKVFYKILNDKINELNNNKKISINEKIEQLTEFLKQYPHNKINSGIATNAGTIIIFTRNNQEKKGDFLTDLDELITNNNFELYHRTRLNYYIDGLNKEYKEDEDAEDFCFSIIEQYNTEIKEVLREFKGEFLKLLSDHKQKNNKNFSDINNLLIHEYDGINVTDEFIKQLNNYKKYEGKK